MAGFIYSLCALAACGCAFLLLRAYERTGMRLLLWSGACFTVLTLNNVLIAVDLIIFPRTDLFVLRNATGLIAIALLLYGLIWEVR